MIESRGKLSIIIYDKRDDFHFQIVNFPFLPTNTPFDSYGVYLSQFIRYAQCCSHYDDFLKNRCRHKRLADRLLSQGYKVLRLEKSFKKFDGRYQDFIEKY